MKSLFIFKQFALLLCLVVASSSYGQTDEMEKIHRDIEGNWITLEEFNAYEFLGEYASPIPDFGKDKKGFRKFWRKYKKNKSEGIQLQRIEGAELEQKLNETLNRLKVEDNLGKELPIFLATDLNGESYDISKLRGKVLVFNYWFTACLPCLMEVSALNKLVEKYKNNNDVVFISFAPDPIDKLKKHLKEEHFLYPTVHFSEDLRSKMKLQSYPTNVVIDRNGKYIYESKGVGFGSVGLLDRAIKKAL